MADAVKLDDGDGVEEELDTTETGALALLPSSPSAAMVLSPMAAVSEVRPSK